MDQKSDDRLLMACVMLHYDIMTTSEVITSCDVTPPCHDVL